MEYADHVAAVDAAGRAIADAFAAGPLDAAVPSCPAWTLRDLARHLWDFTGFWTHVVCEGTGRPKPPVPQFGSVDVAEGYADIARSMVAELRAATADTPAWSWDADRQNVGFVARRAANELVIHRVDVQLARGRHEPIAPELAADGIEEIFAMVAVWGPPAGTGSGESLHLHGTDPGDATHEWMITLTPVGLVVDRSHGKAAMALRGAVSDLELTLYGRPPVGPIEQFGDDGVMQAWRAAFTFE